VPVGRAFASENRSQTQILAGSSESTVSATATANWAKEGAIPALSAEKNCARGGVDVTAVNQGAEAFAFELVGIEHSVPAGESRTVTVTLQEDQAYDFTATGANGFEKRFTGMLDCETQGSASEVTTQTVGEPSPATSASTYSDGTDLAETGSSSATPIIGGIAIALVVVGGAALVLVNKRNAPEQH